MGKKKGGKGGKKPEEGPGDQDAETPRTGVKKENTHPNVQRGGDNIQISQDVAKPSTSQTVPSHSAHQGKSDRQFQQPQPLQQSSQGPQSSTGGQQQKQSRGWEQKQQKGREQGARDKTPQQEVQGATQAWGKASQSETTRQQWQQQPQQWQQQPQQWQQQPQQWQQQPQQRQQQPQKQQQHWHQQPQQRQQHWQQQPQKQQQQHWKQQPQQQQQWQQPHHQQQQFQPRQQQQRSQHQQRQQQQFPPQQKQQPFSQPSQQQQQQQAWGPRTQQAPPVFQETQQMAQHGAWGQTAGGVAPQQQNVPQSVDPVQTQSDAPARAQTQPRQSSGDQVSPPTGTGHQKQSSPAKSAGSGEPSKASGGAQRGPAKKTPTPGIGDSENRFRIMSLEEQAKERTILPNKEIVPGTQGRPFKIETNYIKLDLGNLKTAYHFDVDIQPPLPKSCIRPAMEEFRKLVFPNSHPAFDGKKNLYSPKLLIPQGQEISKQVTVMDAVNQRERNFIVTVKYANSVDLTPLKNVTMTISSPQEARQCVEIVLRNAPCVNAVPAGRSFFTKPARIIELGEGMEMYHGFYQSVVRGWKPFLNVDVAHKAFPKEQNVIDLIRELCRIEDPRQLTGRCLDNYQIRNVEKFLTNLRVIYEIPGQSNSKREYRVNGLRSFPSEHQFSLDNGARISVEEYFVSQKRYRLKYPLMPCLWVGSRQRADPILLPCELCTICPKQPVNRKMTENQTSTMIRHAATSTTIRKEKITASLATTRHNQDPCMREFGFQIGNMFEQVQARLLNAPSLTYKDNSTVRVMRGTWRQDRNKFLLPAIVRSWTIISTCGPMEMKQVASMIMQNAAQCGMSFQSPPFEPFDVIRARQPTQNDINAALQNCAKKGLDLVFVIIPDSGPVYSYVKKAAELQIGLLTQCIKRGTFSRKMNAATVGNILLKVNAKMNGTNHSLSRRPPILNRPCMIMGADVTHPSPDSQNIPSVAAVTASHDPLASRYNICCRLQDPRAEIISDLENITVEHLKYFYDQNGSQKPERIIFFRDGVSEGQFTQVIQEEVSAIRRACKRLQKEDYEPSITFLVVQKRHHTRFFPLSDADSDDANRNRNVKAGTCVDTEITNPNMQDFYLVSHASIQGVAKPTKYCTLRDENNMSNDDIEELTYHLCHLFARCNRSVSYPAPTYYAHLAAARAKVYIENDRLDLRDINREQSKILIRDDIRKMKPMFFV